MKQNFELMYHHHSGFSCAVGQTLLVFDYWRGENGNELASSAVIDEDKLKSFEKVIVFISHSHPDHCDPEVFRWHELGNVEYVVSFETVVPQEITAHAMLPLKELQLGDVTVHSYESTDLGVAYLVTIGEVNIFHAGDLNFWHWREESTLQEIDRADSAFRAAIKPLEGKEIDVACFPLDPRQGRMFDAGANYFLMSVKPRLLIPMHTWGRNELAVEFARRERNNDSEIIAMTKSGEKLKITFEEDNFMHITIVAAKENKMVMNILDNGENPFSDSDLPVEL